MEDKDMKIEIYVQIMYFQNEKMIWKLCKAINFRGTWIVNLDFASDSFPVCPVFFA